MAAGLVIWRVWAFSVISLTFKTRTEPETFSVFFSVRLFVFYQCFGSFLFNLSSFVVFYLLLSYRILSICIFKRMSRGRKVYSFNKNKQMYFLFCLLQLFVFLLDKKTIQSETKTMLIQFKICGSSDLKRHFGAWLTDLYTLHFGFACKNYQT